MSFRTVLIVFSLILLQLQSFVFSAKAFCNITISENTDTTHPVTGLATFTQEKESDPVKINVAFTGLTKGKKGFHIHAGSDISMGCHHAGDHYNPFNKTHGDRSSTERHVGDLGNIEVLEDYKITDYNFEDNVIKIMGTTLNNVVGKACMIHDMPDDLGKGTDASSHTTGNAGIRMGCGVIQLEQASKSNSSFLKTVLLILIVMWCLA